MKKTRNDGTVRGKEDRIMVHSSRLHHHLPNQVAGTGGDDDDGDSRWLLVVSYLPLSLLPSSLPRYQERTNEKKTCEEGRKKTREDSTNTHVRGRVDTMDPCNSSFSRTCSYLLYTTTNLR